MTILSDMQGALLRAKKPKKWLLGKSAYQATATFLQRHPTSMRHPLKDTTELFGLRFQRTDEFDGWELVQ